MFTQNILKLMLLKCSPAYGVNVSQLIRYVTARRNYQDFVDRGKLLISIVVTALLLMGSTAQSSMGDIMTSLIFKLFPI